MVDFVSNLVMNFRNNASSGLKSVTKEINDQKQALNDLRQTERLRSLEAQKNAQQQSISLRQERLEIARARSSQLANLPGASPATVQRAKLAEMQAESALINAKQRQLGITNRIGIENQKNAIAQKIAARDLEFGLGNAATQGNILQGIIGNGVTLAIGAATVAIGLFVQGFNAAAEASKQVISNTTAISREFDLSRDKAREITREQQIQVSQLGRDLPIEAADINRALSLANNAGMARMAGGNIEMYNQRVVGNSNELGIIPLATILRETLGSTITDIQYQQAIGAISNPSAKVSDLSRLEFVRSSGLQQELERRNFDSAATVEDRLRILQESFANLVPQEAVEELKRTPQAMFSQLRDSLFDPNVGYFGFLRDIMPELEGNQTLFDEATRSIQLIIGEGGILQNLSTGLNVDLMTTIYDGVRGVNAALDSINRILEVVATINNSPAMQAVRRTVDVVSAPTDFVRETIANTADRTGGNPFSDAWSRVMSRFQGGGRAAGQLGNLYGAMGDEGRNAPGSGLVVANSDESILPPGRLAQIINNTYTTAKTETARSLNLTVEPGAITVVAQPNQDAISIAELAIAKLEERLKAARKATYGF